MDQGSTRKKALAALAVASIIWGVSSPVMKLALVFTPISLFVFLRFFLASILILPFKPDLRIQRKDILPLVVASLAGVSINTYLFFYGLKLTSAVNAGIIVGAIPLFTLLSSAFFLKEKVSGNLLLASIIGFLGLLTIIFEPLFGQGVSDNIMGNLLLFLSSLVWVVYEIVSKKLFQTYSAATVTFYSFLIGSLSLLPFALLDFPVLPEIFFKGEFLTALIYGVFLTSLAAYFLWQWGLSKIPASKVGFFFYLDPIVGTIAAILILGESITPYFLVGSVLIFLGLYLAEMRHPYSHHVEAVKG